MQLSSALFLLVFCGQGGEDPGASPGAPSPQTKPPIPWEIGHRYYLSWVRGREKVGESSFVMTREKSQDGDPKKILFHCSSNYRYQREGESMEGGHEFSFDQNLRPLNFKSRHSMSGLKEIRSSQSHEGHIRGGRLVNVVVHNENTKTAVRLEMEMPADAYLLLNQSTGCWAVLASRVLKSPANASARIIFPDLVKVYLVQFTFEGEEVLKLGKSREKRCRRYSFSSKEGQLKGKIWVDRNARMIQYQQGKLKIYLEE